jgi:hypothetical protein
MDTLSFYRGEERVAQVALGARPLELGRGAACDVTLADPELAERHWLAVRRAGSAVAYDVSAGRSRDPRPLPLGQRIRLGREHSLVRENGRAQHSEPTHDTESLGFACTSYRRMCIVVGRGSDARRLRIVERPLHIGRGESNDLVLPDAAASLRHCRLEPSEDGLLVRDLGSSNGTFVKVNGERPVGHESFVLLGQQLFRLNFA